MKGRMACAVAVWAAWILVCCSASAVAATSVGAHLGMGIFSEPGNSAAVISAPTAPATPLIQPGLRVTFGSGKGPELFVDGAVALVSSSGTYTEALVTVNLQYVFTGSSQARPFLNAGGGVTYLGYRGDSRSSPILGAGAGFRFPLSHGGGSLRAEVRVDHFPDETSIVYGTLLGVRLGFDLNL